MQETKESEWAKEHGNRNETTENGSSSFIRDVRAKDYFDTPELCAQFLQDYAGIEMLSGVQAQDIEEMRIRHHFFDEKELNSDNIKKIRVRGNRFCKTDGGSEKTSEDAADIDEQEVYLVTLIEHKSYVDHDVAMQLLRYIVCIWYDWQKEQERVYRMQSAGIASRSLHRTKEFRYPPIIPIVYYDGTQSWSVGMQLKDRVFLGELFREFIPNFTYRVISSHSYSDEELLARGNEFSLLMLIGNLRTSEDLQRVKDIPAERLNRILMNSSEEVLHVIVRTVQSFCRKFNLPDEEIAEYTQRIKERDMGYIFANMEKVDIQAERRKTEEQRRKTEEERKRTEEQKKRTEEQRKKAEEQRKRADAAEKKIQEIQEHHEKETALLIRFCSRIGVTREKAMRVLREELDVPEEESRAMIEKYWK